MSRMLYILCALYITILIFSQAASAAPPMSILLDGFEAGTGKWQANDSTVAGTGRLANLCGIYPSADTPASGGAQSAMLDFQPANEAWASISLPINGKAWQAQQIGKISLWAKATAAESKIWMVLRASVPTTDGPIPDDRSYFMLVQPSSTDWQKMTFRLWGFQTAEGDTLTDELVSHLYMLQFVKTGTWSHTRILIDTLQADPGPPVSARSGSIDQPVIVDFRQNIGRSLAQVGFNFSAQALMQTNNPKANTALRDLTKDLAPCVGRVCLADYYMEQTNTFDITRLNANVNWLISTGVKPLICFNIPPAMRAKASGKYALFESTCTTLVDLRRGTDTRPYYELFERPLEGQNIEVNELVVANNELEANLKASDKTARIGGPGFARALQWPIREFVNGANSLHFLSYQHIANGPIWPGDDATLALAQRGASTADTEWTYEQVASWVRSTSPGTEVYITDWGVRRPTAGGESAKEQQEAAEAVFLASSALSATRYIDKMLWSELTDDTAGLIDSSMRPRPAYWAAWLLRKYAPRGSTCTTYLPLSADVTMAAFRTPGADNVFVVNHTPWSNTVTFRATGLGAFHTVRERKLDPMATDNIQHRNIPSASTIQTVSFEGPGISVVQFIK